jgi:cytochrome b
MKRILVWDWPVRLGHWLMVGGFALAWITAESERWRLVRAPAEGWRYLRGLLRASPPHYTGHNPLGGWAIVGLLTLALASGTSGWLAYQEIGGEWAEELHEGITHFMLALVVVHVIGVAAGSFAHHENLVTAMFTGRKLGEPTQAITRARPWAALLLLGWVASVVWWITR